jgi:uncharacterized Zn-binding protein involved in type VI secretion
MARINAFKHYLCCVPSAKSASSATEKVVFTRQGGSPVGKPAAKQGDKVVAVDMHIIQPPGPVSPVTVPHPFNGTINAGCSTDVMIMGMPAAVQGSKAQNTPPHIPQGGTFVSPPTNQATINMGSGTVMINGKPAARMGDKAQTCDDTGNPSGGTVVASGTVLIGG